MTPLAKGWWHFLFAPGLPVPALGVRGRRSRLRGASGEAARPQEASRSDRMSELKKKKIPNQQKHTNPQSAEGCCASRRGAAHICKHLLSPTGCFSVAFPAWQLRAGRLRSGQGAGGGERGSSWLRFGRGRTCCPRRGGEPGGKNGGRVGWAAAGGAAPTGLGGHVPWERLRGRSCSETRGSRRK